MRRNNLIVLSVLLITFSACDLIKMKEDAVDENKQQPLARVNSIYLYPEDVTGLISADLSPEDSANRMTQMINSWIRKQLVISEANSRLSLDEAELERRLLDYKYALMIHEFEEQYVNRELNKSISPAEINKYYNDHIDNFRLNQNIVKGIFVQLPKGAPNINTFKRLLNSNDAKRHEELVSYCHSYSKKAHLGDSSWVYFEQLVVGTPLQEIEDKGDFLKRYKYFEKEDDDNRYYLKIMEYRLINEISPIEFVWDEIEKIILNKRKVKLVGDLEDEIYERAENNNDFEIYSNE